MKVLVIVKSILNTNNIKDKVTRITIEKSVFNKTSDDLANLWALGEVNRYGDKKEITLELL